MTLELSPPVATVSGAAEWIYESDTPTQIVEKNAPLSIPFTVPSPGTVVVIYKPRTIEGGSTTIYRVIDVYRTGSTDVVARISTNSDVDDTDDTTPYTLFATVSEGEHYLKFSSTYYSMTFDVVSIRIGHIPTT